MLQASPVAAQSSPPPKICLRLWASSLPLLVLLPYDSCSQIPRDPAGIFPLSRDGLGSLYHLVAVYFYRFCLGSDIDHEICPFLKSGTHHRVESRVGRTHGDLHPGRALCTAAK